VIDSGGLLAGSLILCWVFRTEIQAYGKRAVDWYHGPGPSAVEELQQEYVSGEITEGEFERRLELALDSRAVVIRQEVESVSGVGPERSALLADRFESVEEIRRADREELTAVNGIGESTAADIRAHFE